MTQGQELAQKPLLGPAKRRHIGAVLCSAQHGAESNHQDLVQIVPRVVVARILEFRETGGKPPHGTPR